MTNIEKKYHRGELAKIQLKTAVLLFLNDKDLSSVVTLSAAASNILDQLVRNSGKEPFIDYACRIHAALKGSCPKRKSYKHYIDNTLGVNVHKHMGPSCHKTCTLDLQKCAIDSLTMAIADYISLYGQSEDFVRAFLRWTWDNIDTAKIIELYNNMPNNLKKIKKPQIKMSQKSLKKRSLLNKKITKKKTYQRLQLAANQFETAIMLVLTNADKLSAITLSGAADVIFCELVNREGKSNFTDVLHEKESGGRDREDVGREVNNLLCINQLKHYDKDDEEYIVIDVDECVLAAILKALVNYKLLKGENDKLVMAFQYWVSVNLDLNKYNLNSEHK